MGFQDPTGDEAVPYVAGCVRLHRLLGCRAEEPTGSDRWHCLEGKLLAATTQLGIHGQEPSLGHCL